VKGKLAYMAPEQASSGKTDSRSDLFSMGVIFGVASRAGAVPHGEHGRDAQQADERRRAAPSTVDPALAPLDGVLAKALSPIPAALPHGEEFAQAIGRRCNRCRRLVVAARRRQSGQAIRGSEAAAATRS